MVSENGMGVQNEEQFMDEFGVIQDDYKIEFLENHLKWLHKAIGEGCNCFGFHMWCPFDSWSWSNAYKNRYGFIRINLDAGRTPIYKKSAYWFQKVSENNGFISERGI